MYALISRAGDPTPRLEELPTQPLGPDDIRVEVAAAGFTLFDAFVAGDHAAIGLPDVIGLGFDFSGVVTEVGEAVSGFAVGDRVAGLHGNPAAGARAHATEVVLPASAAAAVPDGLTLEAAAAAPLNALTAR
ncbi:alcohol dehydrogenase catalytic domain-containing protein, partial [Nocardioides sp. NPDC000441]